MSDNRQTSENMINGFGLSISDAGGIVLCGNLMVSGISLVHAAGERLGWPATAVGLASGSVTINI